MICDRCSHYVVCKNEDYDIKECGEFISRDVIKVKHGEWIHLGGDEWSCSECGNVIFTEGSWEKPYERDMFFCNKCGADMRSVTE